MFCLALLYVSIVPVHATSNNEIMPCYHYTQSNTASLKKSANTITCYSTLTGYPQLTTKITTTMYLEKKTWWWWTEEKSWTKTTNSYYNSLSKSCVVDSGTYRLRVKYIVYDGKSNETIIGYSNEETI